MKSYHFITTLLLCCLLSPIFASGTVMAANPYEKHLFVNRYKRIQEEAEKGYPNAQFRLAAFYYDPPRGSGFTKNTKQAFKLWKLAALQGHAEAQYNLGLLYNKGLVIEKDKYKALAWFQLAADNQQPKAVKLLKKMDKTLTDQQKAQVEVKRQEILKEMLHANTP